MNKKEILVPEHWLIDTGLTTYWPFREGIWVNKETGPTLRVISVYFGLMDIPEAVDDLNKCNGLFITENSDSLDLLYNLTSVPLSCGDCSEWPTIRNN